MSPVHRRFAIAYILLVGLPLLGLVGALKAGRHLSAPVSVEGRWKLEADLSPLFPSACQAVDSSAQEAWLLISQSGKYLEVSLPGQSRFEEGLGTIEGATLRASLPAPAKTSSQPGCRSEQPLSLVAIADAGSNPESLTGTLSAEACSSCAAINFRAMREAPTTGRKGAR